MNSSFDGGSGLYGSGQLGALAELGRLLNKSGRRQGGSWKRVVLVLAVIAMPAVLLLASGLGS